MPILANTTVNWRVSPRIITIDSAFTEITVTDLHETLLDLEDDDEGMIWETTRNTSGGEALGGGVTVGVTVELQNAQIAFEARTTPLSSGTATANSSPDPQGFIILEDSAATFVDDNVGRGDLVINVADGSQCSVIEVLSQSQARCEALIGGSDNSFDIGDSYDIYDVVQCRVSGGNLVAVDDVGSEISPVFTTFGTQVLLTASSSATSQNAASIEYAAFNGQAGPGVWIDVINGVPGTGYFATGRPIGTPQDPVNNVGDALLIDAERGLPKTLYVIGDLAVGTGDDLTGFKIVGQNAARTTLTLGDAATIVNCDISEATVTGSLDGNAIIRTSYVQNITYFSGFIFQCEIAGTITLGGGAQADILSCYSGVAGQATPTIDMGGSGQALGLRDYSGGVRLINKTGTDQASIDLAAGQVRVDLATCTNGTIVVRGPGKCVDDANTDDYLISGTYGGLTIDNETVTGLLIQEMWQRLDMDPDSPNTYANDGSTITGAGFTLTRSPSGNSVTITRT